jgi:hypothetical protein
MACTHSAAMSVLGTFAGAHGYDRNTPAKVSAAARLLRAYATQVEALRRLKNGGSQVVRVEHVHVNQGGQALIGNVKSRPGPGRLDHPGPALPFPEVACSPRQGTPDGDPAEAAALAELVPETARDGGWGRGQDGSV